MADDQTKTPPPAKGLQSDESDLGLDLNNLPGAPWTKEALGYNVYRKLAVVSGAFDPELTSGFTPPLDPRTFAQSRANRRMQLLGLAYPPASLETAERAEGWFREQHINADGKLDEARLNFHIETYNALSAEAEELDKLINAKLPALAGTPRGEGAKPLTPAKLVFKQRRF